MRNSARCNVAVPIFLMFKYRVQNETEMTSGESPGNNVYNLIQVLRKGEGASFFQLSSFSALSLLNVPWPVFPISLTDSYQCRPVYRKTDSPAASADAGKQCFRQIN